MPDISPKEQMGSITIPFAALQSTLALDQNQIAQISVDNAHGELTMFVVGPDMPLHSPGERVLRCNIRYSENDEGAPVLAQVTWTGKDNG